jgi:hypothetical protein
MPPRGVKETLSRSSLRALQPVGLSPSVRDFLDVVHQAVQHHSC